MTNDMEAMASTWEKRLRPPKCDRKDGRQVRAASFCKDKFYQRKLKA